jgi:hypothetical protein
MGVGAGILLALIAGYVAAMALARDTSAPESCAPRTPVVRRAARGT